MMMLENKKKKFTAQIPCVSLFCWCVCVVCCVCGLVSKNFLFFFLVKTRKRKRETSFFLLYFTHPY